MMVYLANSVVLYFMLLEISSVGNEKGSSHKSSLPSLIPDITLSPFEAEMPAVCGMEVVQPTVRQNEPRRDE